MANRISAIFDIDTKGGVRSLGDLRNELKNTDGVAGKAKVALSGVGDYLKANMVEGALAAATAVVAFGVKSVQAFTDTALSAGKLADATGLTVEESSRWLEVAGDVGVSGEQLTSMFSRLERSIGANPQKFRDLGVEMQRNADGSVNMTETMLAAIDAIRSIEDPTERAKVSQETFGRSYAEVAELIEAGAGNVRQALDDVSDAKVIDEEELAKARQLRASMDNLKDSVEDVALMFGQKLAPEVAETADNLVWLKGQIDNVTGMDGFGAIAGAVEDAVNPLGVVNDGLSELRGLLSDGGEEAEKFSKDLADADKRVTTSGNEARATAEARAEALDQVRIYSEYAAGASEALADAEAEERAQAQRNIDTTQRLTDEYVDQRKRIDDLIGRKNALIGGEIAVRQAQRDARTAAQELTDTLADQSTTMDQAAEATDAAVTAQLDAAQAAADYRAKQLEANGTTVDAKVQNQLMKEELQRLAGQLDGPLRDALLRYIEQLNAIPKNVNTVITANGTPGSVPIKPGAKYASGTMSAKPGVALVGEQGPELVELNGGERIYNARQTGEIMSGGGSTVIVQPGGIVLQGTNLTPNDVVNALDTYARRGGILPSAVRRQFSA